MTLSLHITLTRTPYAHAKDSAQPCAFEPRKTLSLLSQHKGCNTPSPTTPTRGLSLLFTHIPPCKRCISSERPNHAKNHHPYAALPLHIHDLTLHMAAKPAA